MTDHVMYPIPDPDVYAKNLGVRFPVRTACVNCGIWDKNISVGSEDCDVVKQSLGMKHYQAGGQNDPFAGMRINGKVIGAGLPPVSIPLGTLGVGAHGMPVRNPSIDPGHTHEVHAPAPAPAETRPGLAPETIDRKAYDEFMKGL